MTNWKDTAVALDHVSKTFGEKQVLRDITFSVARAGDDLCFGQERNR